MFSKVSLKAAIFATALLIIHGHGCAEAQETKNFTNPILDYDSPDPHVIRLNPQGDENGFYYLTLAANGGQEIVIHRSRILTSFRDAETFVAYRAKNGQTNIWAPELHLVNNELYIYFCADGNGEEHRNYVVKGMTSDPFQEWSTDAVSLMPEMAGIDGTILNHGGKLYYVWANTGWLWMSRMVNPMKLEESKLILRKPTAPWELQGQTTNEGPFFIYRNDVTYLVFSASFTFEANYCLGMMYIPDGKDPFVPSNWNYGANSPVFSRNDEEGVYAPGHASFTVSNDGTETWMVYHASDSATNVGGNRVARIEKIDWDENGLPVFPRPHGFNSPIPVPSGQ